MRTKCSGHFAATHIRRKWTAEHLQVVATNVEPGESDSRGSGLEALHNSIAAVHAVLCWSHKCEGHIATVVFWIEHLLLGTRSRSISDGRRSGGHANSWRSFRERCDGGCHTPALLRGGVNHWVKRGVFYALLVCLEYLEAIRTPSGFIFRSGKRMVKFKEIFLCMHIGSHLCSFRGKIPTMCYWNLILKGKC